MTAMKRNHIWVLFAGLVVIAILASASLPAESAPAGIVDHPSSHTSLAITTAQKAALLGAQQLLLGSDQTSWIYVPMIIK